MSGDKKEFYALLNIPTTATSREIKSAFRNAVKLYHPDKNKDPKAHEKYLKINEAYQVLSDPEARNAYDSTSQNTNTHFVPCSRCGIHSKQPRYVMFDEINVFTTGVFCRDCASKQQFKSALKNWKKIVVAPISVWRALKNNQALGIKPALKNKDVLMQNAVAFLSEHRIDLARILAEQALKFSENSAERTQINAFLTALPTTHKRIEKDFWRIRWTDTFRVFFPLFITMLVVFIVTATPYLKELLHYNNSQLVNYRPLPVMPITINLADEGQLFHTTQARTPVYQAPCLDCGIIDLLPAQTTVRLTGVVPDTNWIRVMLVSGNVVFIQTNMLGNGRGSLALPYSSKITRENR